MRLSVSVGAKQPAILPDQGVEKKISRPPCCIEVSTFPEHPSAVRQRADHHAVPRRDDLVVQPGFDPLQAGLVHFLSEFIQAALQGVWVFSQLQGDIRHGTRRIGDALPLPIPQLRNVVERIEHLGALHTQHALDFIRRPHEEPALNPFGVRVGGRVEAALRRGHLPEDVVQCLAGDAAVVQLPGDLERLDVRARQERVVVEHLLEVGHEPLRVGRVARKPAADLVVHAASGHGVQRLADHVQRVGLVETAMDTHQKREPGGRRKLRRRAESAERSVEVGFVL